MDRTLYCHAPTPRRPGIARRFWTALTVARQRRRLSQLDDHLLSDIGLDRASARRESDRAVWDVPGHWTR